MKFKSTENSNCELWQNGTQNNESANVCHNGVGKTKSVTKLCSFFENIAEVEACDFRRRSARANDKSKKSPSNLKHALKKDAVSSVTRQANGHCIESAAVSHQMKRSVKFYESLNNPNLLPGQQSNFPIVFRQSQSGSRPRAQFNHNLQTRHINGFHEDVGRNELLSLANR